MRSKPGEWVKWKYREYLGLLWNIRQQQQKISECFPGCSKSGCLSRPAIPYKYKWILKSNHIMNLLVNLISFVVVSEKYVGREVMYSHGNMYWKLF